ncbi:hypothetical protein CRE_26636 [Caenorhabditis remanei]|uniref:Uncharacterized protein n=1 Tax=Caenorhabditis remanei TaxID=31234 RepID=E3MKZ3_CAERE|nr:hypothetical protein CRE_26636 [Caenorhabditis remanei]
MRSGSIKWKNFKITILHNSGRCGSAHTLFRHRNDFSCILTKEQRVELEKLEKFHKDVTKHYECEMKQKEEVQEMVDGMKKFLKKIEEKFVSFVQKIIDESQQTVVTFSSDKLVIFFRKSLNENDNFWKMVFSDGTRHNIFKAREEMKLITLYQCKVKDCKWKEEGRLWYVWSTHEVTNKTIGNKEGVYIEINEKLINHENETLIRLVRDNHPAYEGDDEALKIQLKREFIFLRDERHCLISVNIAGQLNMLGSVDENSAVNQQVDDSL